MRTSAILGACGFACYSCQTLKHEIRDELVIAVNQLTQWRGAAAREQDERPTSEHPASLFHRSIDDGRGGIARAMFDGGPCAAREEGTRRRAALRPAPNATRLREQAVLHQTGCRQYRAAQMAACFINEVHRERRPDADDAYGTLAREPVSPDRADETIGAEPPGFGIHRRHAGHATLRNEEFRAEPGAFASCRGE